MRLPSPVRLEGERVVVRDLAPGDVDAFVAARAGFVRVQGTEYECRA